MSHVIEGRILMELPTTHGQTKKRKRLGKERVCSGNIGTLSRQDAIFNDEL